MTEQELIDGCRRGSMRAQRALYHHFAPKMMGICMRYAASEADAEDLLQDGFITVFKKIDSYAGRGEFGAWVRKVFLNTALMNYRKTKKLRMNVELEEVAHTVDSGEDLFGSLSAADLMRMMQKLPAGCRMVFNLYAVEGYNHREIAERMEISVGTSKSQYSRARALLRTMIEQEERKVRGRAY